MVVASSGAVVAGATTTSRPGKSLPSGRIRASPSCTPTPSAAVAHAMTTAAIDRTRLNPSTLRLIGRPHEHDKLAFDDRAPPIGGAQLPYGAVETRSRGIGRALRNPLWFVVDAVAEIQRQSGRPAIRTGLADEAG